MTENSGARVVAGPGPTSQMSWSRLSEPWRDRQLPVGVADLIRDTFKRGKYQDVILPLTVLRRLDCVLAPTKQKVLGRQAELRSKKLENLDPQLRKASGFAFYNTSRYDFDKGAGDSDDPLRLQGW
jgi:HsdM-like protein